MNLFSTNLRSHNPPLWAQHPCGHSFLSPIEGWTLDDVSGRMLDSEGSELWDPTSISPSVQRILLVVRQLSLTKKWPYIGPISLKRAISWVTPYISTYIYIYIYIYVWDVVKFTHNSLRCPRRDVLTTVSIPIWAAGSRRIPLYQTFFYPHP